MSTTEIHPKVEKIRQGIHQNLKKVFYFGKFNHDLSLFDGKTILQIASGATHYLILTAEHELYAVGSNNMGQLGQVLSIEKEEKPVRMNIPEEYLIDPINEKIMKVSTKGWHNLVLLNTGRVFVNGSNRYGQLGLNKSKSQNVRTLTPILLQQQQQQQQQQQRTFSSSEDYDLYNVEGGFSLRFEFISAGVNHSVIATVDGGVYSCGWGQHGQTGHGEKCDLSKFTRVKFFDTVQHKRIRDISSGGEHSLVLMSDGSVYVMGHFQKIDYLTPMLITSFNPNDNFITQVTSGDFFAMVLTSKGNIYSFGENDRGQCGLGSGIRFASQPTKVEFYETSHIHSAASSDIDAIHEHLVPMRNVPRIRKIIAGSSHSMCICGEQDEETVFAWGRGESDRLGKYDSGLNHFYPVEVECLCGMRVKQISASGMYTLLCNSEVTGEDKFIKYMFTNLKQLLVERIYADLTFHFN